MAEKQNAGNRTPGSRPKARSTAKQQAALWSALKSREGEWTARDLADTAGVPKNTALQYLAALTRAGMARISRESKRIQSGATPAEWRLTPKGLKEAAPPMVAWKKPRIARRNAAKPSASP